MLGTLEENSQYAWSAIASVDLMKNGGSLTQTNRGSQLMGGAVGGLLLGPVGLLAGAVTGSKRASETVQEIALRIVIDDRVKPIHTVTFLRVPRAGLKANHALVKQSAKRADHFYALLANAMRSCAQRVPTQNTLPDASLADQVAKLWDLKVAGALSMDEFDEQKAMLISQSRLPTR